MSNIENLLAELGINQDFLLSRGLFQFEQASDLELVQEDSNGREHYLVPKAASAWRLMRNAALSDGILLILVSAFRSYEYQAGIIQRKLDRGLELKEILKVSAAPGYSEHHTGRAIDIATVGGPILEEEFEFTDAFKWLNENAGMFHFQLSFPKDNPQGYLYEPWHWCHNKI